MFGQNGLIFIFFSQKFVLGIKLEEKISALQPVLFCESASLDI